MNHFKRTPPSDSQCFSSDRIMKHALNHRRSGFTLTELAIVLGIVGVIIAAIFTASANVQNNNRANQAAQDIMQIASNVRAAFSAANTFPDPANTEEVGKTAPNFISANIIPADLVTGTKSAMNAWGGNVKVYENPTGCPLAAASTTLKGKVFRVSFYNTPQDACFRIASQLANLGTVDGPIQLVTAGCNDSLQINQTGTTVGLTTAQITAACAMNGTGGTAAASTEFDFEIH